MARQLIEYIIQAYSTDDIDTLIPDLTAWNIRVVHRYHHLSDPTICVMMTGLLATWFKDDPRIKSIEESQYFSMMDRQNFPPKHLDRIDQRNLPLTNTFTWSLDGTGVIAYILDSGCNFDHPNFEGRVSPVNKLDNFGNPIPGVPFDPFFDSLELIGPEHPDFGDAQTRLTQLRGSDELGHGTHVAGLAGSATFGVAKKVTLKTARIFGKFGSTGTGTILAGIDAILADFVESGADSAVCNMSFGAGISQTPPVPPPGSTPLEQGVLSLVNAGITVVAAAGNGGTEANFTTPPSLDELITVGAVDQDDSAANFTNFGNPETFSPPEGFGFPDFIASNTGSAVDIFSPGTNIVSTSYDFPNNFSTVLSGTSMASPIVAGVAVLVLENDPSATPSEVATIIDTNATVGVLDLTGTLLSTPNKLIF